VRAASREEHGSPRPRYGAGAHLRADVERQAETGKRDGSNLLADVFGGIEFKGGISRPAAPVRIRDNVDAYVDDQGVPIIQVRVPSFDGRERTMRVGFEGMSGEDIGEYANFMITLQTLESMGMTDVFGKGDLATDGASNIPIYPATDIAHMKDVTQALVNGFSGDNGEILSQPHIDQMRHAVQWFHPEGDHAKGNYSQAETRERLKGLGIMDENNTIAWDNWRIAGEFIQTNYGSGEPDYQKLQKHMDEQLGVELEEEIGTE
jgi:hypothetical protein